MLTRETGSEAASVLEQGIRAAKGGDREGAREILSRFVELEPGSEAGWLWLASLHTELPAVAHCLERALAINPDNRQAGQALQSVRNKLNGFSGPLNMPSGPLGMQSGPLRAPESGPLRSPQSGPLNGGVGSGSRAVGTPDSQVPTPGHQSGPLQQSIEARQSGPLHGLGHDPSAGEEVDVSAFDYGELKRRGIVAAKGGRRTEARAYLIAATDKNDTEAETWYWLSTVLEDVEDRQIALENVLTLDPLHPAATAALEETKELMERGARGQGLGVDGRESQLEREPGDTESRPLTADAESPTPGPQPPAPDLRTPTPARVPSKLFALAGGGEGQAAAKRGGELFGGRYTILSSTTRGDETTYVVCEPKKRVFLLLQPRQGDGGDAKGKTSDSVMEGGVPYAIVPIGTEGLTLRSFIGTVGKLPAEMVAQYGVEMLKTLGAEHAKGPILAARKQVTPDTVVFDAKAQLLLDSPEGQGRVASASAMAFLPTEQVENGSLSPTSDIYAVGALLFFMVTGAPPPPAESRPRKEGESLFPGHFTDYPEIPEDLARVLAIALQPAPQERYGSASEMEEALRGTSAGKGIKKEIPLAYIGLVAAVVVAAMLAWALGSGRLGKINIPFLGAGSEVVVSPTAVPVVAAAPTAVPQTLGRALINAVDSRGFPANTVYFSALDTNGVPMPNFGANSFELKENGATVAGAKITELRRTTEAISVIVALDNSSGMAPRQMDDAKTAIRIFADQLQPGDRMALITFGGSATTVMSYTVSKSAFLGAVDPQQAGGAPAFAESVARAAEMAKKQTQRGLTAMVVVSNGAFLGGRADVSGAVNTARSANLPVYFVGLDRATYPEQAAGQLAAGTGGFALAAETADTGGAAEAMKRVAKQLYGVYRVTYEVALNDPNAPHNLEVILNWGGVFQADARAYQVWPAARDGLIFGPGAGAPDPNKDP